MSSAVDTTDNDGLISAFLDNELDDAGHHALEAWLSGDRANQRRFLNAVIDHRALAQQLQAERHPTVRRQRVRSKRRLSHLGNPWAIWLVTIAALVMLAVAGALWVQSDASIPRLKIADASVTSRVARGEHVVVPPDRTADLLYDDGTRLTLLGGCEVIAEGSSFGKRVTVVTGKVTATVAHQSAGKPFIIMTANAQATVLGTSLSVETDGTETDIAVAQGRVTVQRRSDLATVEVASGERSTVALDLPLRARADTAPAGRLYHVGLGQPFATIADLPALVPGDVIELHAGIHRGAWSLLTGGTKMRPITIRGAAGDMPLIDSEGLVLHGEGQVPRAALQLHSGYWRVEHLAFANARNGENAAGIRLVDASDAWITDCRIAHCDNGVVAVTDSLTVNNCDIGFCGTEKNDGYGRDVSIIANRAVLRGCYLHDQLHGQSLRSICGTITVEACRIVNAEDGEITIATGTQASNVTFTGNLVVSKPGRSGSTKMRFILVEGEGRGTLHLVHNTCIADSEMVTFIAPVNLAVIANHNIFSGKAQIALPGNISGQGNWLPASAIAPSGFTGTLVGADPGFVDPAAADYRLRADSPGVGKASPVTTGFGSRPAYEPAPTAQPGSRPRRNADDLGAFAADH